MTKVFGPLMSLDASGTLADAITFSKWRGRNYVRERVIPSNPKSGAQVGRRAMFAFLTQAWNALADGAKASWQDLADQIVASRFNGYMRGNMIDWHNFIPPTQLTPAGKVGTPSDNVITAAAWEENRIKITIAGSALGDAWGICLFASLTGTYAPSVGNCILVEPDTTIASHDVFWTPPAVTTYYLDSVAFADDGVKAAEGGEQTAAPP